MATVAKSQTGKHPGGAKTILTKKRGQAICDKVAKGIPKEHACLAQGISLRTVLEWVARGEGRHDRPPTPITTWFAEEWRKSEALDVIRRGIRLEDIAERDDDLAVKIDLWWLERRQPEHFAPAHQRVEVTGQGGGPITIKLAFDPTPIAAASRRELGGPVIDLTDDVVEET